MVTDPPTHPQTNRQGRLQYTAPQLSVQCNNNNNEYICYKHVKQSLSALLLHYRASDATIRIQNSHPQIRRHWWSAPTQQYCPHLCLPHDIFLLHRRSHAYTAALSPPDFVATTSEHGISVVWLPQRHCTAVTPSHGPHSPAWHRRWQRCPSSAITTATGSFTIGVKNFSTDHLKYNASRTAIRCYKDVRS